MSTSEISGSSSNVPAGGNAKEEEEAEVDVGSFRLKNKLRVLYVDDNYFLGNFYVKVLECFGASGTVAENGQQALDIVRAGEERFDLVLIDSRVAVLSAAEVTKGLVDIGVSAKILVVGLEGAAGERQVFLDAGANGCIDGPIKMVKLAQVLKEIDINMENNVAE